MGKFRLTRGLVYVLALGMALALTTCKVVVEPGAKQPVLELTIQGGKAVKLTDSNAGLPLSALPGVKRISFNELLQMKEVPKTGLYLLDTGFVPFSLPADLKKEGYVLRKDGNLVDLNNELVTMIVFAETFQVVPNPHPHPWALFSWYFRWKYNGGFCRDYRAWTTAEAWGPEQDGYRPHTRIEYIETRAEINQNRHRNSCFDCDREDSYVKQGFGCFWPAIGGVSGFHYAHWADADTGFSATRTWSW